MRARVVVGRIPRQLCIHAAGLPAGLRHPGRGVRGAGLLRGRAWQRRGCPVRLHTGKSGGGGSGPSWGAMRPAGEPAAHMVLTSCAACAAQPVTMVYEDSQGAGRKVMQMYLGSRVGASARQTESVASLPAPTEPNVRVSIAGGELIAVRQFEGYITPTNAEAARQALLAALRRGERTAASAGAGRDGVLLFTGCTSPSGADACTCRRRQAERGGAGRRVSCGPVRGAVPAGGPHQRGVRQGHALSFREESLASCAF